MMYPPQDAYPPQQQPFGVPYSPQDASYPQQPFGMPYLPESPYPPQQQPFGVPYSPQDASYPQQPFGAVSYFPESSYPAQQPFGVVPYSPQGPYPLQEPFMVPQPYEAPRNLRATRAIINGLISLILSVFTLFTLAGFAGLITGTLAIIYGCLGLRAARQLPSNMGRRQAIIGIVLGCTAWVVVIVSLIVRAASPSG